MIHILEQWVYELQINYNTSVHFTRYRLGLMDTYNSDSAINKYLETLNTISAVLFESKCFILTKILFYHNWAINL